jgi:guanylate kinase
LSERGPRGDAGGTIARRGLCLVLVAPSGAGKSSIARALLASDAELGLSISATTRAPRPGEQDSVHYRFVTPCTFDAMIAQGALLEWAQVYDDRYGSPAAPVRAALQAGRDMLFDIDWQGAAQLRAALPGDVVQLAILPPSLAELEHRLRARGQDAPERIARRMAKARDEIAHCREADYVIVNRDFDAAVADAHAILRAARLARSRLSGLEDFLADLAR